MLHPWQALVPLLYVAYCGCDDVRIECGGPGVAEEASASGPDDDFGIVER